MKNLIFSVVGMAFMLDSCKPNSKGTTNNHSNSMSSDNMKMTNDTIRMHNKSNTMANQEKIYACPMHAEVTGNRDEKCSKCGMKLTEPVPEKKEEKE